MGSKRRLERRCSRKCFKRNEARRLCACVEAMGQLKCRARLDWRERNCGVSDEALKFGKRFRKFCLDKLRLSSVNQEMPCSTILVRWLEISFFQKEEGYKVHSSFRRYSQGNPSQVIFKEIAPSSPADATTRVVKMVSWRMKTVNYLREQTLRHNIFYFKAVLKFS